jgi:hypothetical protein
MANSDHPSFAACIEMYQGGRQSAMCRILSPIAERIAAMPLPFQRIFKRRGLRQVLLPFTLGLAFIAVTAFMIIG